MNILRFFFGICGSATALFLFLAPLVTFRRIIKTKSTQQFSGVPYSMTLLNCLLSAWYGLPFVSPHNILVTTINGTGAVIEGIYVVMFIIYAPKKARFKMMVLLALALIIFASISMVSLFVIHEHKTRMLFCGLAATIFSICMYASPLSVMCREYMPFFLSLFVFLCGTSWFAYGLLGGDPFIAVIESNVCGCVCASHVPNGFGCGLGALQLILYTIYRNPKSKSVMAAVTSSSTEDDDDFIELGFEKPLQKTAIPTAAK
ncbi:hypothetical protein MKX01_032307 [Papaver californicum]|nr:hypothetical protein MKX01_030297 [Papaver californicum]KAI3933175.1 hypothetical protein MKX01_032307 [Papaver californicum]